MHQHYEIRNAKNIQVFERNQRLAARFCTHNYPREIETITHLVKDLQWDTLRIRRQTNTLTIIYKMEHNLIYIPLDHYIKRNTRCSRKHEMQFVQIRHSANIFGNTSFPTTIKAWSSLHPCIASNKSMN